MELKKVKKLVINQEVISNLNEKAMVRIKGGATEGQTCPNPWCQETVDEPRCQPSKMNPCPSDLILCLTDPPHCKDTNIVDGDCATWDYEICRYSDYHCDTTYWCY